MPPLPSFLSNLPALRLTLSYLLHDPPSLLPHLTTSTLLTLPLPLGPSLPSNPRIRALVLDKDNTLCPPTTSVIHPDYITKLSQIRSSPEFSDSKSSILIVSNTAGSSDSVLHEREAQILEKETGLRVLRQDPKKKKPLCSDEILEYFAREGVTTNPSEIVVVGDRLATDVLLGNELGAWSVWVRDGWRDPDHPWKDYRGVLARWEGRWEEWMRRRGRKAPVPIQSFEEKKG